MSENQNIHEFELTIEGEGVSPSTVGVHELVDVLASLAAVVSITAKSQFQDVQPESELHLVKISEGSVGLTFAATERMYQAAKVVTRAIAEDRFDKVPLSAHDALRKLSRRAKSFGRCYRVSSKSNGMVEAAITPDKELLLPTEVSGKTTLLAKIDRVGGENSPTAWVILERGEKLTVELKNKAMALALKEYLFKVVALEGDAVWNFESWEIKRFVVDRIGEFQDTPIREAFHLLSEAAGNRWENVDPEKFVAGLRTE